MFHISISYNTQIVSTLYVHVGTPFYAATFVLIPTCI